MWMLYAKFLSFPANVDFSIQNTEVWPYLTRKLILSLLYEGKRLKDVIWAMINARAEYFVGAYRSDTWP